MHLETIKISLPLKKKFVVSQGEAEAKTSYITILNNRYNGEASGSVYLGPSDEILEAELIRGVDLLSAKKEITAETLLEIADFDIHPTVRAALSGMVLNFLSGEAKRYPWEILSLGTPVGIRSSFTISIENAVDMANSIKDCEYPIVKIKMGHEEDILILDLLDQVKDKEIRVDANGGWSCAKAEEMIFHLGNKGVKVIEQPTEPEFVKEWSHLKSRNSEVELIMDEGMNSTTDFEQHFKHVDGINIKMEKCGGIVEGIRLSDAAHLENKKVMLGCMVASSVGISQSVYMSSKADYFDLDGPLLLEHDIADGLRYDRESIEVDREIIGGPKIKRDVIEQYITK